MVTFQVSAHHDFACSRNGTRLNNTDPIINQFRTDSLYILIISLIDFTHVSEWDTIGVWLFVREPIQTDSICINTLQNSSELWFIAFFICSKRDFIRPPDCHRPLNRQWILVLGMEMRHLADFSQAARWHCLSNSMVFFDTRLVYGNSMSPNPAERDVCDSTELSAGLFVRRVVYYRIGAPFSADNNKSTQNHWGANKFACFLLLVVGIMWHFGDDLLAIWLNDKSV